MATTMVTVSGVVRPDGTLELPTAVGLPPGPVEVTLRSLVEPTGEDVMTALARIRARQAARGYVPRSAEEIDADLQRSRDEWEEHSRAIEQIQEEAYQKRQQGAGPAP